MPIKSSLSFLTALFLPFLTFANCDAWFDTDIDWLNDTVCVGVPVTFTNNSTMNGTFTTFQWSFGDASSDVFTENATHTYSVPGDFTVTYRIGSTGCNVQSVQKTIHVIAPPTLQTWVTNPECFGDCHGDANIFITGPVNNYTIVWDDPNTQNTETAVNLCDGVYTATVSDPYGCSTTSAQMHVIEPAQIIVEAGADVLICEGSQWPLSDAGVISGGNPPYTYLWDQPAYLNDETLLNPILDITDAGAFGWYELKVVDSDGCASSDSLQVIMEAGQIGGTIYNDAGSGIPNLIVELIKVGIDSSEWEYIDSQVSDANGDYYFAHVPVPDYKFIVLARETTPINYMPTYYGDTIEWSGAVITEVECGTAYFQTDIIMKPILVSTGTCKLRGTVYLVSTGKTLSTDPIPLIDVVVKKTPPGNAIASTQTGDGTISPEGQFEFENMEVTADTQYYKFTVNIPGLGMRGNYHQQVLPGDSLHANLDFYVDTTSGTGGIWTSNPLGVTVLKYSNAEMTAYPNPFTDNCELSFLNVKNGPFTFTLFDVTGKIVMRDDKQEGNAYDLKTNTLQQGVYIAEVKTAGQVFKSRVIKK